MLFLEPFAAAQRDRIRASVRAHAGPDGVADLESRVDPDTAYAEWIIDLLGANVHVRPDGTPEGDADDIISVIDAVTERWT
ncbi:hypothetical protein AAFP35_04620 [Gordonia sp. CPCC 206044]|uniref:hypothetical protein n=1 Tax=Gordonia sp. CPCC 206044 TaxID=3140793 RepID=UPI003AF3AFA4